MTTIVGIISNGQALIAADQKVTTPGTRLDYTCKIVDCGDALNTKIGISGHKVTLLALRSVFSELELVWDGEDEIYSSLLAIHDHLKNAHHLLTTEGDMETPYELSPFSAILINASGLYQITSQRDVLACTDGFAAVGNGREFALGAIAALGTLDPEATARRALEIASDYDLATGGNIDVEIVQLGVRE